MSEISKVFRPQAVDKIQLGEIVLYHLSDGQGGMIDHAGIVIGVYPDHPQLADIRVLRKAGEDFNANGTFPGEQSNTYTRIVIP